MATLILALCFTWAAAPVSAQTDDFSDWPESEPWVVRAYFSDLQWARDVAGRLAAWEFEPEAGYFVVDVTAAKRQMLLDMGFHLELDRKLTAKLTETRPLVPDQRAGIPGYPCYRTVEETFSTAQQLITQYPDLAEWIDIGDSWEKVQLSSAGYDMMVLHITNQNIAGDKPDLFVMGGIHARELTTAELNTRFAEYLLQNYGTNADATWLVDTRDIHLILQTNPDGRKMAETGLSWRKNTNDDLCTVGTPPDGPGIDLNRNFPFQWGCCGGSSGDPCDVTYRGTQAQSEPETQAVVDYATSVLPDQRDPGLSEPAPPDAQGVFLDLHSYGGDVLWPWGFGGTPPNSEGLYRFARKLAYFNGYTAGSGYTVDGSTKDFGYGEFGVAAYTIELGTSFFQDCASFEETIFPDNLAMLVHAAKACEAPYLISKGPDAVDLTFVQTARVSGTLTATLDDSRYNGTEPIHDIAAAICTIDELPSAAGATQIPMDPVDGTWDNPIEAVQAQLDLTGLGVGQHAVYVQGQDADDNWGTTTALFVYVPSATTYFQGTVTAPDGTPIQAQIAAGGFQTASSPTTGAYQLFVAPDTYDLRFSADQFGPRTLEAIPITEGEAITRDVMLCPYVPFFTEDGEHGTGGWTADAPWGLTTQYAHSGTHSWTDSPGTSYANNQDLYLTSPLIDLTDAEHVTIAFWTRYDLESGYDYVHLEVRSGGGGWTRITSFNGTQTDWTRFDATLPDLAGASDAQIRFYLHTDVSQTRDGFYVDDIQISATETNCAPVLWGDLLAQWPTKTVLDLAAWLNAQTKR